MDLGAGCLQAGSQHGWDRLRALQQQGVVVMLLIQQKNWMELTVRSVCPVFGKEDLELSSDGLVPGGLRAVETQGTRAEGIK